jgi:hypothetical protein
MVYVSKFNFSRVKYRLHSVPNNKHLVFEPLSLFTIIDYIQSGDLFPSPSWAKLAHFDYFVWSHILSTMGDAIKLEIVAEKKGLWFLVLWIRKEYWTVQVTLPSPITSWAGSVWHPNKECSTWWLFIFLSHPMELPGSRIGHICNTYSAWLL